MFGSRLIDLLAPNNQEVASFGSCNTNSGSFIRLYDSNILNQGYLIGKSNSTFVINRNANLPISVGIGTTYAPNNTCVIQGTLSTSNIISYNTDNTVYFTNTNISGINNINFTGTLLQNGQNLKTSQWESVGQNIVFPSKVGIGTTNIFNSGSCNLYVSGDVWIDGKINASNLNIYGEVLASSVTLSYSNPSNDGTKTILTNDSSYQGRIVSTFQLTPGRYMISLNIPYANLTGANLLDSVSWLNINLYQSRAVDFNANSVALRTSQITAIPDKGSITLYWLYDTPGNMQNYSDHIIALDGKGHLIKLASNYSMMCLPIRGLGYDDRITVRQSLSVNPIKSSTIITNPITNVFYLSADGYLTANASNIDVYVAGSKIPYSDSSGNYYTYVINYNNNNSQTTFTITLANTISSMLVVDDVVDISIFPQVVADTYFSSGYLYQSIVTSSSPWMNVTGGGVRIGEKVAIDGDLYVKGNIWGGCNTNIFSSGVEYTGLPAINAASNAIGTINIADGAVTVNKLNLINGNLGIGTTLAKAKLDINGNINIDGNIFQNGSPYIGSQWIGPTTGPIYFNSNIGIGTNTPANRLSVVGNVGIGSIYSGVRAPLNSLIIEGNVGIGSTQPAYRIDIDGIVNATSFRGSGSLLTALPTINGLTIGTYGSSTAIPSITVDSYGRITTINTNSISGWSTTGNNSTTGTVSTPRVIVDNVRARTTNGTIDFETSNGTTRMSMDNSGNLTVTGDITGFGSISDSRLKENLESLPTSIKNIMKLNVVEFNWNINIPIKEKVGTKDIGLIAQEVEKIFPLVVYKNDMIEINGEKTKIIKYEKIVPYLIKAMQEQQIQIEELTNEVRELKNRLGY